MANEAVRMARYKIGLAAKKEPKPLNDDSCQNYLNSGSWKCPDAPINVNIPLQVASGSGAHYWLEFRGGQPGEFYCRYCYEVRKFKIRW